MQTIQDKHCICYNVEMMFLLTAFGFCEYEDPEATLRCIRLLNEWAIADKKLVVSSLFFSGMQIFVVKSCKLFLNMT